MIYIVDPDLRIEKLDAEIVGGYVIYQGRKYLTTESYHKAFKTLNDAKDFIAGEMEALEDKAELLLKKVDSIREDIFEIAEILSTNDEDIKMNGPERSYQYYNVYR